MKLIKNKKPIAYIAVVLFLALILLPSVAFGESNIKITASADKDTIFTGDVLTVTVRISNAAGSAAGQFNLKYDPDVLELRGDDAVTKGDFFEGQEHLFVKNDLVEGDVGISWIFSELVDGDFGSTKDAGVIATIVFDVTGEGDAGLQIVDLIVSDSEGESEVVDVEDKIKDIETIDFDSAKEKAIADANRAIDVIVDLDEPVTLADEDIIKDARRLVTRAVDEFDADIEEDFPNIKVLEEAEERYDKLLAIFTANNAIAALPAVDQLTLDDEDAVKAARVLVDAAKSQHGAVDADFPFLSTLRAAENKIAELKGLRPTPPTGGSYLIMVAGLFFLAAVLLIYKRRRLLSV